MKLNQVFCVTCHCFHDYALKNSILNTVSYIPTDSKANCNHMRAISYYLESMTSQNCPMTSFPCSNWNEFTSGECTSCIYSYENRQEDGASVLNPSSWFKYFSSGDRRRRTSAPKCLELGISAPQFWREHERRAGLAETNVININAYLKTESLSPYCCELTRVLSSD